jgi:hypothetical protein
MYPLADVADDQGEYLDAALRHTFKSSADIFR